MLWLKANRPIMICSDNEIKTQSCDSNVLFDVMDTNDSKLSVVIFYSYLGLKQGYRKVIQKCQQKNLYQSKYFKGIRYNTLHIKQRNYSYYISFWLNTFLLMKLIQINVSED